MGRGRLRGIQRERLGVPGPDRTVSGACLTSVSNSCSWVRRCASRAGVRQPWRARAYDGEES